MGNAFRVARFLSVYQTSARSGEVRRDGSPSGERQDRSLCDVRNPDFRAHRPLLRAKFRSCALPLLNPPTRSRYVRRMTSSAMLADPKRDQQLLTAWLHGPTHITDIANENGLSAPQLAAWAVRPDIAAALAAIREFTTARAEVFSISCAAAALARLLTIVEQSDDEQSARRAATAILRFHDRSFTRRPRAGQPPVPPVPGTPSPRTSPAEPGPEPRASLAEPSFPPAPSAAGPAVEVSSQQVRFGERDDVEDRAGDDARHAAPSSPLPAAGCRGGDDAQYRIRHAVPLPSPTAPARVLAARDPPSRAVIP